METTISTAAHDALSGEDLLFLCPDRDAPGFVPSGR
jgi:hypothetical protein